MTNCYAEDGFKPIRIAHFITWLIVIQKMDYILIEATLIIMCLNLPERALEVKKQLTFRTGS